MLLAALLLACATQDPFARVHDALFLRTGVDGRTYGAQELEPYFFPGTRWPLEAQREAQIHAALAALHEAGASGRSVRERLVMQRDLRAVFEWVFGHEPQGKLAGELARAIREVASPAAELRELRSDIADVLDAKQGFVLLGDAQGRTITPAHESHLGTRSRFEVLMCLPGGREATLAWLERLRALPDPLTGPAEERRFRADLPLLPPGTRVALVRRALAFSAEGELVATDLVESVQMRRLVNDTEQVSSEFRLDRSGASALREMRADELDFNGFGTHGEDPFEGDVESWSWRKPGLHCTGCHAQPGIYAVNSFTRMSSGPGTILYVNPHDRPSVFVEVDRARLEEQALRSARDCDSLRALLPR